MKVRRDILRKLINFNIDFDTREINARARAENRKLRDECNKRGIDPQMVLSGNWMQIEQHGLR